MRGRPTTRWSQARRPTAPWCARWPTAAMRSGRRMKDMRSRARRRRQCRPTARPDDGLFGRRVDCAVRELPVALSLGADLRDCRPTPSAGTELTTVLAHHPCGRLEPPLFSLFLDQYYFLSNLIRSLARWGDQDPSSHLGRLASLLS